MVHSTTDDELGLTSQTTNDGVKITSYEQSVLLCLFWDIKIRVCVCGWEIKWHKSRILKFHVVWLVPRTYNHSEVDSGISPAPEYHSSCFCRFWAENGTNWNSENVSLSLSLAKATALFSKHTKTIVWGMQTRAVQGMLDFDYVCSREEPSVAAMVYPFT